MKALTTLRSAMVRGTADLHEEPVYLRHGRLQMEPGVVVKLVFACFGVRGQRLNIGQPADKLAGLQRVAHLRQRVQGPAVCRLRPILRTHVLVEGCSRMTVELRLAQRQQFRVASGLAQRPRLATSVRLGAVDISGGLVRANAMECRAVFFAGLQGVRESDCLDRQGLDVNR